jgi:hypothetical protein
MSKRPKLYKNSPKPQGKRPKLPENSPKPHEYCSKPRESSPNSKFLDLVVLHVHAQIEIF